MLMFKILCKIGLHWWTETSRSGWTVYHCTRCNSEVWVAE